MKKDKELRVLAKNLYWYDYLDAKEMDTIYKGGKLTNKEKVREYKFTTDIEEENLPAISIEPALPAEDSQPLTQVQGNKVDGKEDEKQSPKKPGPDDNSGSEGGPGGERLIPESILPGRNGDSANPQ